MGFLTVGGLFDVFRRKTPAPREATAQPTTPTIPAGAAPITPTASIRRSAPPVLYPGLHTDTNPSANVRTAEMTCAQCDRQFRYFLNSSGGRTLTSCPGCGRQYRV